MSNFITQHLNRTTIIIVQILLLMGTIKARDQKQILSSRKLLIEEQAVQFQLELTFKSIDCNTLSHKFQSQSWQVWDQFLNCQSCTQVHSLGACEPHPLILYQFSNRQIALEQMKKFVNTIRFNKICVQQQFQEYGEVEIGLNLDSLNKVLISNESFDFANDQLLPPCNYSSDIIEIDEPQRDEDEGQHMSLYLGLNINSSGEENIVSSDEEIYNSTSGCKTKAKQINYQQDLLVPNLEDPEIDLEELQLTNQTENDLPGPNPEDQQPQFQNLSANDPLVPPLQNQSADDLPAPKPENQELQVNIQVKIDLLVPNLEDEEINQINQTDLKISPAQTETEFLNSSESGLTNTSGEGKGEDAEVSEEITFNLVSTQKTNSNSNDNQNKKDGQFNKAQMWISIGAGIIIISFGVALLVAVIRRQKLSLLNSQQ